MLSGQKKQTTLPFKPVKREKKRNPWSDSDSDSASECEVIDVVPPKDKPLRQTASK